MKPRSEYQRERIDTADKLQERLRGKVRSFQRELYRVILPFFDGLETDGESISYTVRNIAKGGQAQRRILDVSEQVRPGFIGWILNQADKILRLNRLYFKASELSYEPQVIDTRVRERIFRNLGYDVITQQLIPNGWIGRLTATDVIARQVSQDMERAIATRMPLKEFKDTFRKDFINPGGLGYLERHYNTFAFDLYQSVDRETQRQYSEELGLNYALYSGTVMKRTRPFCESRAGKYYSREEIAKWKNIDFKGKFTSGYDPFIHCGGYNCRHHLSFVSEEYMRRTNNLAKVNTYR